MATKSPGRKKRSEGGSRLKALKRENLLGITIEVIATQGLDACTFRVLAERAGTSTAPFTYEFGSRREMLKAVVDSTYEVVWPTFGEDPGEDPVGTLYRGFEGLIGQRGIEAEHCRRAYYEVFFQAPRDPELMSSIAEIEIEIQNSYLSLVRAAQDREQIDPERDPSWIVNQIWSLVDGLNLGRFTYPEQFADQRVEEMFRDGFERLIGSGLEV